MTWSKELSKSIEEAIELEVQKRVVASLKDLAASAGGTPEAKPTKKGRPKGSRNKKPKTVEEALENATPEEVPPTS